MPNVDPQHDVLNPPSDVTPVEPDGATGPIPPTKGDAIPHSDQPHSAATTCPTTSTDHPEEKEAVILIHGTFAFDEDDAKDKSTLPPTDGSDATDRWWQRGSMFADSMASLSANALEAAPKGKRRSYVLPWWWNQSWIDIWRSIRKSLEGRTEECPCEDGKPEGVFHWSGENSESARRNAGELLLAHLNQFESLEKPYHVVAHSHGGGALWEALCLATKRAEKSAPSNSSTPVTPLRNLKTWTTVATPYMHFQPSWRFTLWVFPLLGLVWVWWAQRMWFQDFWRQNRGVTESAITTFLRHFVIFFGVGIVIGLGLRFIWSLYCYFDVSKRVFGKCDPIRRRDFFDVISSLIAFAAGCAIIGALSWYCCFHEGSYAINWWTFGATTWAVFMLVLLMIAATRMVLPFILWRKKHVQTTNRLATWAKFCDRSKIIAYQERDEAINALRAVINGFQGQLLPRMPSPRAADLSPHGRILCRPEHEVDRQTFRGWAWTFLLMPLAIIKDWVIGPIYNEVFILLIESFVFQQLTAKAHGADVAGEVLFAVTPHPMLHGEISDRLIAFPSNEAVAKEFQNRTDKEIRLQLNDIRNHLHTYRSPNGVDLLEFFKEAMQGKSWANALVHTTYFFIKPIQKVIADHILNRPTTNHDQKPQDDCPETTTTKVDARTLYSAGKLAGFCARLVVRAAIFMAPAWLMYFFGWLVVYEWSLDYHKRWARNVDVVREVAIAELADDARSGNTLRTPISVRWACAIAVTTGNSDYLTLIERLPNDVAKARFAAMLAHKFAEVGNSTAAEECLTIGINCLDTGTSSRHSNGPRLEPIRSFANSLVAVARVNGTVPDVLLDKCSLERQSSDIKSHLRDALRDPSIFALWRDESSSLHEFNALLRSLPQNANCEKLFADFISKRFSQHELLEKDNAFALAHHVHAVAYLYLFSDAIPWQRSLMEKHFYAFLSKYYSAEYEGRHLAKDRPLDSWEEIVVFDVLRCAAVSDNQEFVQDCINILKNIRNEWTSVAAKGNKNVEVSIKKVNFLLDKHYPFAHSRSVHAASNLTIGAWNGVWSPGDNMDPIEAGQYRRTRLSADASDFAKRLNCYLAFLLCSRENDDLPEGRRARYILALSDSLLLPVGGLPNR